MAEVLSIKWGSAKLVDLVNSVRAVITLMEGLFCDQAPC